MLATGGWLLFGANGPANLPSSTPADLQPTRQPDSTRTPGEPTEAARTTNSTSEAPATQPAPLSEIPADIAAQMDEIEVEVERLRGLDQREPITRTLLSAEQLRERMKLEFLKENDEQATADDLRVLSAFGLIEPNYDLFNFYLDLYTEQVAGYYDDEAKEMVVILGEEFDGPERSTYAHEFTHLLQDQQYGLSDGLGLTDENCEADSEYCAAVQALTEGDASLTEQYWLYTYGSEEDRQQIDDFYQSMQSPVFDSAPLFMQEDLGFAYIYGAEFVLQLFETGGYQEIDAAFANPPVSTEQILHPNNYPYDQPLEVFMPDFSAILGQELREIDRGVIGEWYTYLTLAKGRKQSIRLSDAQAKLASAGWGGDAYAVYLDESNNELFLAAQWVWDTQDDAHDFYDALEDYGRMRWGKPSPSSSSNTLIWADTTDGTVIVQGEGLGTAWVITPDGESANLLLQSLGEGEHAGVN